MIGTGMMGQIAHLSNYARLRDDEGLCDIIGVTDLKQGLARAVADRYRVPTVYGSVDELLADPAVDGVACIQQWPNNFGLVKQILAAGKSVITEKPMVGRLDEAEELTALAKRRGVHYAVGFMKRYDPGVEVGKRLLLDALATGRLGALRMVDATCNGGDWLQNPGKAISVDEPTPLPPLQPTYPDACTTDEMRRAYDWIVNIFSHTVNLTHHLLDTELDLQYVQITSSKTLVATALAGDVTVIIRGVQTRAHEWREWTTFTFDRGEIRIDTPVPLNRQQVATVTVLQPDGDNFVTSRHHAQVGWAFALQARGFAGALAGGEPPRSPARECLKDVRVMQRMIEILKLR